MFNHRKVRELITSYYVKQGEVASFENPQVIEDESLVLEVKVATYLWAQARVAFEKQKPTMGTTLPYTIDGLVDELIVRYGLNGEKNSFSQNKMIWNILESEGHIISGEDNSNYYMLKDKSRDYGEAILRYVARTHLNYDLEEIEITEVPSTVKGVPNKIVVDFKKGPVLNTRPQKVEHPLDEKVTTVVNDMTTSNDDAAVVAVDVPQTAVGKYIRFIDEQIVAAKQSNDEETEKYWSLRKEEAQKQEIDAKRNLEYARKQRELAIQSHDEATQTRWEEVIYEIMTGKKPEPQGKKI